MTYWHVYGTGRNPALDGAAEMYMTLVIGPHPLAVDDANENGVTPRMLTIPNSLDPDGPPAVYLASFDHEPTDAEMEALAPEEGDLFDLDEVVEELGIEEGP